MVTPKQGLSASDLANRARVATLKRNGTGAPDDPLERALADDRRLQANALTRRSLRELEADERRAEAQGKQAELDLIRAEIERFKLEQERQQMQRPVAADDDGVKELLFAELQKTRERLDGLEANITQSRFNELQERLNELSAELTLARNSDSGGLDGIIAQLEQAQKLVALTTPQVPAPTGENAALTYARLRLEASQEDRRQEMELRREDNAARLAQDRELRDRELSIQESHYVRIDRFMGDTAPKLLALGQTLLQKLGGGAPAQAAAAAVSPETPEVKLAPGVNLMNCAVCGAHMFYRDSQESVICNNCAAEHWLAPPPADEPQEANE